MHRFAVLFLSLLSLSAAAQQPLPAPTPAPTRGALNQIPGPSAPAATTPSTRTPYEVLDGTKDLGTLFYTAERDWKLQRNVGHGTSIAMIATCEGLTGNVAERIKAVQDMHTALKTHGPTIYKGGARIARRDANNRVYYTTNNPDVTTNGTMSQIVAVLTCKADGRSANDMAKMLNSAYEDAINAQVTHPDTKEKLSWGQDLNTLLMVATLLK